MSWGLQLPFKEKSENEMRQIYLTRKLKAVGSNSINLKHSWHGEWSHITYRRTTYSPKCNKHGKVGNLNHVLDMFKSVYCIHTKCISFWSLSARWCLWCFLVKPTMFDQLHVRPAGVHHGAVAGHLDAQRQTQRVGVATDPYHDNFDYSARVTYRAFCALDIENLFYRDLIPYCQSEEE